MLSQEEVDALVKTKEKPSNEEKNKLDEAREKPLVRDVSPQALNLFQHLESKLGETIALLTSVQAQTLKEKASIEPASAIGEHRFIISLGNTDDGMDILIYLDEEAAKSILSQIAAEPDNANIFSDTNMDALGRIIEALSLQFSTAVSFLSRKHFDLAVALPKGLSGLQDFLDLSKEYLVLEYSLIWDEVEVGKLGFIVEDSSLEKLFLGKEDKKDDEPAVSLDSLIESMNKEDDEDILSQFSEDLSAEESAEVVVKPVQFGQLKQKTQIEPFEKDSNLDIILDLPVSLTVELGRTHKTLKEILDLKPGSIIELERLAGEPVDVLANGVFVAKGEVVVIDETFGVKITEIASKQQRITRIK